MRGAPPEKKIVAIGGGTIYRPCNPSTTLPIDKEIVRLVRAPSTKPVHVLYVATASNDNVDWCNGNYVVYQLHLRCRWKALRLLGESVSDDEVAKMLAWANVIYLGGGDTALAMRSWRERGVDKLLLKAHKQGKVLCGISAGAIAMFEWGLSDSESYTKPKGRWKPTIVEGLGIIPGGCCPHYDVDVWRPPKFFEALEKRPGSKGIALDDDCALEVLGGNFRFLEGQLASTGYSFCSCQSGGVSQKRFTSSPSLASLDTLWPRAL